MYRIINWVELAQCSLVQPEKAFDQALNGLHFGQAWNGLHLKSSQNKNSTQVSAYTAKPETKLRY